MGVVPEKISPMPTALNPRLHHPVSQSRIGMTIAAQHILRSPHQSVLLLSPPGPVVKTRMGHPGSGSHLRAVPCRELIQALVPNQGSAPTLSPEIVNRGHDLPLETCWPGPGQESRHRFGITGHQRNIRFGRNRGG